MKRILSIVFICFVFVVNAQIQNYNWRYGHGVGITWNITQIAKLKGMFETPDDYLSDLPTNVTGSLLNTYEGCFTISDSSGDLLMYSDGQKLWDKNNVERAASLGGSSSSAQSGTIVKYPYSFSKYIMLTLSNLYNNNLSYRVIDVDEFDNLSVGSGFSLTGHSGKLGETVTAGRHKDKNSIWVLAVGRGTGTAVAAPATNIVGHPYLNVWRLFDDSVDQTVLQNEFVGAIDLGAQGLTGSGDNPNGYVRFTNDSKHFAWVNYGKGEAAAYGPFLLYGDFDNETGAISNVRIKRNIRPVGITNSFAYGVEFTNDNKYIYVTLSPENFTGVYSSSLLVYDFEELLQPEDSADPINPTTLTNTRISAIQPIKDLRTNNVNIGSSDDEINPFFGAIQTGPDGRMYISNVNKYALFVIDNPKDPENLRMYKLPTLANHKSYWGLPNFAVPWFDTGIEIPLPPNSICAGKDVPIDLFIVDGEGFDRVAKIVVDFGDGSPDKIYTQAPDVASFDPNIHISPGERELLHVYKLPRPFDPTANPVSPSYRISVTSFDASDQVVNSSVKTIFVNPCVIKVNPFIRGEIN